MRTDLLFLLTLLSPFVLFAQPTPLHLQQEKDITFLINNYALARETKDTLLLRKILMPDVDQLVSTGEWRRGVNAAVQEMLKSSASNPGTRTLAVERIRNLTSTCAVADCRYEIQSADSVRRMWSTFIVVAAKKKWRISAIRNMLPVVR